jgi:hypothetical protein
LQISATQSQGAVRVNVGLHALPDGHGDRGVVFDPILEMVTILEECIDVIHVVVRGDVVRPSSVDGRELAIPALHPLVLLLIAT